jgi:hypothetical protein
MSDRNDGQTRKKTRQLPGDLKETREYWKLNKEALYVTL